MGVIIILIINITWKEKAGGIAEIKIKWNIWASSC